MKKTVIYIILSGWMFAGCGTYSRYHRPDLSTENLYRDVPADIDTTTIASLSWREMFTDPKLQSLIEPDLNGTQTSMWHGYAWKRQKPS